MFSRFAEAPASAGLSLALLLLLGQLDSHPANYQKCILEATRRKVSVMFRSIYAMHILPHTMSNNCVVFKITFAGYATVNDVVVNRTTFWKPCKSQPEQGMTDHIWTQNWLNIKVRHTQITRFFPSLFFHFSNCHFLWFLTCSFSNRWM